MSKGIEGRGHRSFEEIISEPVVWAATLQELEQHGRYEENQEKEPPTLFHAETEE